MPGEQTGGDRHDTEPEHYPAGSAGKKHLTTVTDSVPGSTSNVGPVGQQTETGKETRRFASDGPPCGHSHIAGPRQQGADDRPRPDHHRRVRIWRYVGARDGQWMEHDARHSASRCHGPQHMPQLMDRHHAIP